MTIPRIGLTAFVMLWLASGAGAQTTVDVSRLPIDIERIQRELQQSASREEHEGLNLRYVVEVYGQAPPIVFFGPDDDIVHGPVPDGSPTHREMIEHVTGRINEYDKKIAVMSPEWRKYGGRDQQ